MSRYRDSSAVHLGALADRVGGGSSGGPGEGRDDDRTELINLLWMHLGAAPRTWRR